MVRKQELPTERPGRTMPLLYVFLVVDGRAFGAATSPAVNARALEQAGPAVSDTAWSRAFTITGRAFGAAALATPALGEGVAVAVLRSET